MYCKQKLWTGNKCYGQGKNAMEWTGNKCYGQVTNAIDRQQMLWTVNKCFGQATNAVDREQMLWTGNKCCICNGDRKLPLQTRRMTCYQSRQCQCGQAARGVLQNCTNIILLFRQHIGHRHTHTARRREQNGTMSNKEKERTLGTKKSETKLGANR